jgi:hypothetical protein
MDYRRFIITEYSPGEVPCCDESWRIPARRSVQAGMLSILR